MPEEGIMADDLETRKLLEATETLLSNIREQREALDRRERDLLEDRARYFARLNASTATVIPLTQRQTIPSAEDQQEYESIRGVVRAILEEVHGKKLRVSDIANELERREVKTDAGSYETSARNALRYWMKKNYVKQQPLSYYRWIGTIRGAELLESGVK
jgi:nitrogen fixation/metabolism regulation signal transduction histidine kinase